jgi:hypothetical protein
VLPPWCFGVHLTSVYKRAKNGRESTASDSMRKICHAIGARTLLLSRHMDELNMPNSGKMLFSRMVLAGMMSTGSNELSHVWLANYCSSGRSTLPPPLSSTVSPQRDTNRGDGRS